MTLSQDRGERVATCDACGAEEASGAEPVEFINFINHLKGSGWRIKKVDDGWEHYCPRCATKEFNR